MPCPRRLLRLSDHLFGDDGVLVLAERILESLRRLHELLGPLSHLGLGELGRVARLLRANAGFVELFGARLVAEGFDALGELLELAPGELRKRCVRLRRLRPLERGDEIEVARAFERLHGPGVRASPGGVEELRELGRLGREVGAENVEVASRRELAREPAELVAELRDPLSSKSSRVVPRTERERRSATRRSCTASSSSACRRTIGSVRSISAICRSRYELS